MPRDVIIIFLSRLFLSRLLRLLRHLSQLKDAKGRHGDVARDAGQEVADLLVRVVRLGVGVEVGRVVRLLLLHEVVELQVRGVGDVVVAQALVLGFPEGSWAGWAGWALDVVFSEEKLAGRWVCEREYESG